MQHRTTRRGRGLVVAAAALGLLGLPFVASPATAGPSGPPPKIKVMTRNLYLGADIMRPIAATNSVPKDDPECPEGSQCYQLRVLNAFANANDTTRDVVDATDFAARVELLADELETKKPDLVGLQEVSLWRSGAFESPLTQTFLTPNATTVDFDFLQMLLDELASRGVTYQARSVNTLADVEGPAYEGNFGSHTNARDVRLTMRDVILVRDGGNAEYVEGSAREATYDDMLSFSVSGKTFEFRRGYQSIAARADGKKFRFINTHLEAFSSDIAYKQAEQMLAGPGSYGGTTILVCDCNSDPANGTIKTGIGDTKRHWAPYFLIKREGGFNDTWLQWAPPEEGFTSGLSETVDDETAAGFDHRIDLVFARTGGGQKLSVISGDVTGDEVEDRNEDGLWPSDHAGVVMRLRLP